MQGYRRKQKRFKNIEMEGRRKMERWSREREEKNLTRTYKHRRREREELGDNRK